MLRLAIVLLALSPLLVSAGLFSSKSDVKMLTGKNFKKTVTGSDKATLAAFVAPWCGHCKKLTPEYEKAATNLKGLVNFVAVDCDNNSNKATCAEYGIQGFPTVKVFPSGKAQPEDYPGARTAKALVDHAVSIMPTFAKRIKNPDALTSLLDKASPKKPISILFTTKPLPSPLYKALSADLRNSIDFHYAVDKSGDFEDLRTEKLGLKGGNEAEVVVVWGEGENKRDAFEGKFGYDALTKFYNQVSKKIASTKEEL